MVSAVTTPNFGSASLLSNGTAPMLCNNPTSRASEGSILQRPLAITSEIAATLTEVAQHSRSFFLIMVLDLM